MKRQPLLLTLALLLIFVASTATAQNETQKYKVVLPEEEGWIAIPAEAAPGETVIIKYTGDKKVLDVEVHQIISLDKTTTSIYIGNTDQLTATTYPENQTVTWSSGDESVATVDEDGVVTGVAAGTATITATFDESSESCEVTVEEKPSLLSGVFSVSSTNKVRFTRGNLQATTTDYGTTWAWDFAKRQYDYIGDAAANNKINGNGTVSENGTVDLFGWVGASSTVLTNGAAMYGISNSRTYEDYGNIPNDVLKSDWGTLFGSGSEYTTLTASEWCYLIDYNCEDRGFDNGHNDTRSGKAGHADIVVGDKTINGVILLPDDWIYPTNLSSSSSQEFYPNNPGYTYTYTAVDWQKMEAAGAVFLPRAGFYYYLEANGGDVFSYDDGRYWSSSALNSETSYLLFGSGSIELGRWTTLWYNKLSVRLVRKIISLDKTNMSVCIGNTDQLTATTYPENQTVTWSSSDESVATVSASGVVTGVSEGTATITATYDGCSESCEVTVTIPITSISISGGFVSSESNPYVWGSETSSSKTLTVDVLPANATQKNVEWSSDAENVTVDKDGKITIIAPNMSTSTQIITITATATDCSNVKGTYTLYLDHYVELGIPGIQFATTNSVSSTWNDISDKNTLPSVEEWESLWKNCYWVWSSSDDEGMYVFKAQEANQTEPAASFSGDYTLGSGLPYIFLPIPTAEVFGDFFVYDYWSGTELEYTKKVAYCLNFGTDYVYPSSNRDKTDLALVRTVRRSSN